MKLFRFSLCLLVFLTSLYGCAGKTNAPSPAPTLSVGDYFVYQTDTRYTYEGMGNEYASYALFVDYKKTDRVQVRINNGGSETVKVIENSGGAISVLFSKGEIYYRENMLDKRGESPEILLKEPIQAGTEWTLPDGRKRSITSVDAKITTPLGSYSAIEVTTEQDQYKTMDYYAKGVGLIKSVFLSGGAEVSSTLAKMEENTPFTQDVDFYYPSVTADQIQSVSRTLEFKTNDTTSTIFENEYRSLAQEKLGTVITTNAKINSLKLGDNNMVYVDFSKEFRTEMNAGSGVELMILQCITNTLGDYYQTDKVVITIAGAPYSSGHIEMKEGEPFTVKK